MKIARLFLLTAVVAFAFLGAKAQVNPNNHYVPAYTRSDGTTVTGHYKTDVNSTNVDNYTTKPNTNPYTGKQGSIEPEPATTSSYSRPTYTPSVSSSSSQSIQTGPRGGQYYINSNGNKTYVK